jgi:phosphatidylglycerophosphate synthase
MKIKQICSPHPQRGITELLLDLFTVHISNVFVHFGIKANTITAYSFISFALASYLFYLDRTILTVTFLIVATTLDSCDGKVARATNTGTSFGKMIDLLADRIGLILFMAVLVLKVQTNIETMLIYYYTSSMLLITVLTLLRPVQNSQRYTNSTNKLGLRRIPIGDVEAVIPFFILIVITNYWTELLYLYVIYSFFRLIFEWYEYWK